MVSNWTFGNLWRSKWMEPSGGCHVLLYFDIEGALIPASINRDMTSARDNSGQNLLYALLGSVDTRVFTVTCWSCAVQEIVIKHANLVLIWFCKSDGVDVSHLFGLSGVTWICVLNWPKEHGLQQYSNVLGLYRSGPSGFHRTLPLFPFCFCTKPFPWASCQVAYL